MKYQCRHTTDVVVWPDIVFYLQWCGLGLGQLSLMEWVLNVLSNQNCPVRAAPTHTDYFQSHSLWGRL